MKEHYSDGYQEYQKEQEEKFVIDKNLVCEKCIELAKNKATKGYCSSTCYYNSKYDYRDDYFNYIKEKAKKIFNIRENKKDLFEEFCRELEERYY